MCWHLALSTKGGVDRDLSDEEWAAVAREAVRQLGFDAGDAKPPAVGWRSVTGAPRPGTTTCTSS